MNDSVAFNIFVFYVLFAVTTGIVFLLELFNPVLQVLEDREPENQVVHNKFIASLAAFFMAVLTAPFVIFPCIIPSFGNSFRRYLETGLSSR